jgi:hypothetical protein
MILAGKIRELLPTGADVGRGALGISSETLVAGGKALCMATNAPLAEILSAVANSRNSFPFAPWLRTNRGTGIGSRIQARRSFFSFPSSKLSPRLPSLHIYRTLAAKHFGPGWKSSSYFWLFPVKERESREVARFWVAFFHVASIPRSERLENTLPKLNNLLHFSLTLAGFLP